MEINELGLIVMDRRAVVSSRDIARVFEKRHADIMRDIRAVVENDPEWGLCNFAPSSYINEQNKQQPEYFINRDGFTILVMGYTGEKAMQFKKAYIKAFNEMEQRLNTPAAYKEALKALVAEIEAREALEEQNQVLQLTAAKYECQTDMVGLYKTGEIAEELGTTAVILNRFLQGCRVQYKPNERLYADYIGQNLALPRLVRLENGRDMPVLLWTPNFIFDLVEREMPLWYA